MCFRFSRHLLVCFASILLGLPFVTGLCENRFDTHGFAWKETLPRYDVMFNSDDVGQAPEQYEVRYVGTRFCSADRTVSLQLWAPTGDWSAVLTKQITLQSQGEIGEWQIMELESPIFLHPTDMVGLHTDDGSMFPVDVLFDHVPGVGVAASQDTSVMEQLEYDFLDLDIPYYLNVELCSTTDCPERFPKPPPSSFDHRVMLSPNQVDCSSVQLLPGGDVSLVEHGVALPTGVMGQIEVNFCGAQQAVVELWEQLPDRGEMTYRLLWDYVLDPYLTDGTTSTIVLPVSARIELKPTYRMGIRSAYDYEVLPVGVNQHLPPSLAGRLLSDNPGYLCQNATYDDLLFPLKFMLKPCVTLECTDDGTPFTMEQTHRAPCDFSFDPEDPDTDPDDTSTDTEGDSGQDNEEGSQPDDPDDPDDSSSDDSPVDEGGDDGSPTPTPPPNVGPPRAGRIRNTATHPHTHSSLLWAMLACVVCVLYIY